MLKNGKRKDLASKELRVFLGDDTAVFISWLVLMHSLPLFFYSLFVNCLNQSLIYFTCKFFLYCNWQLTNKNAINNGKKLANGLPNFGVDMTNNIVCALVFGSLFDVQTNMFILSNNKIRL
jgi:hypothetical protein